MYNFNVTTMKNYKLKQNIIFCYLNIVICASEMCVSLNSMSFENLQMNLVYSLQGDLLNWIIF